MSSVLPVRFGLIGTGMVAAYHRDAILHHGPDHARLVCVAHHDPARFPAISSQFGVPCVDAEAVLSHPEVDAVVLCTPSGQHAAQAVEALRAGKHVLVEKPMALSLADADRMIEAAEAAGVMVGVVYQRRHDPLYQSLRRAIADGALGDLTLASLLLPYFRDQAYYDSAAWRGTWALDGGGVLMNQGIHMVDVLVWLMGDPIDVSARGGTLARDIEVEDVVAASLRFSSGAVATLGATTTARPGFPHRLSVYGTGGGFELEGESLVRWESVASVPPPHPVQRDATGAGTGGDPRGIAPIGHVRAIADFVEAVQTGRSPAVDGREGRRSLKAVLDVYRAAGFVLS